MSDNGVSVNMTCQRDAPGVVPLLHAECVAITNDSWFVNEMSPAVRINAVVNAVYNTTPRTMYGSSNSTINMSRTVYEFSLDEIQVRSG